MMPAGSVNAWKCTTCGKLTADDAAALIAAERRRQVEAEGWTPEHDDEHGDGVLARAAVCYIGAAVPGLGAKKWPWSADWWKPSDDPVRNLVKAGALIAAEIDRLQRARRQP